MKRLSIVLSILMFQAAMALPALAQSSSDEFSPGFYAQAGFAIQFQTSDISLVASNNGNQAYGGSIAAGYFLTNWLALQGRAQFIDSGANTLTYIYSADAKLYVLNLLMSNPNGLIQPYAIAGLGGYTITSDLGNFIGGSSQTWFTLELGAGLDFGGRVTVEPHLDGDVGLRRPAEADAHVLHDGIEAFGIEGRGEDRPAGKLG